MPRPPEAVYINPPRQADASEEMGQLIDERGVSKSLAGSVRSAPGSDTIWWIETTLVGQPEAQAWGAIDRAESIHNCWVWGDGCGVEVPDQQDPEFTIIDVKASRLAGVAPHPL